MNRLGLSLNSVSCVARFFRTASAMASFKEPQRSLHRDTLWVKQTAGKDFQDPTFLWSKLWGNYNLSTFTLLNEDKFLSLALSVAKTADNWEQLNTLMARKFDTQTKKWESLMLQICDAIDNENDKLRSRIDGDIVFKICQERSLVSMLEFISRTVLGRFDDESNELPELRATNQSRTDDEPLDCWTQPETDWDIEEIAKPCRTYASPVTTTSLEATISGNTTTRHERYDTPPQRIISDEISMISSASEPPSHISSTVDQPKHTDSDDPNSIPSEDSPLGTPLTSIIASDAEAGEIISPHQESSQPAAKPVGKSDSDESRHCSNVSRASESNGSTEGSDDAIDDKTRIKARPFPLPPALIGDSPTRKRSHRAASEEKNDDPITRPQKRRATSGITGSRRE